MLTRFLCALVVAAGSCLVTGTVLAADAPAAQYKLDEGVGNIAHDTGAAKQDGQIKGAKWGRTDHGPAVEFDGVASYIDCGDGSKLEIENAVSVSAWVLPKELPVGETVVAGEGTGTYALTFYKNSNAYFYAGGKRGGSYCQIPIEVGKLQHLAGTFDGQKFCIYVNGKLAVAREMPDAGKTNSGRKLVIGGGAGEATFFNGLISDVRIYNRALSEEEVSALYQGPGK